MPKNKIDYTTTLISFYKFVCEDEEIVSCYVGHTSNFIKRKNHHKNSCNKPSDKKHNLKLYQVMRENGGWNNWKMIEIENKICLSKRDAERHEQELMIELKANMNSYRAFRTDEEHKEYAKEYYKQYNQDHKDERKECDKKYYQKNKTIMKERMLKYYENNKEILKHRRKERYLFESKKVVNGCYDFIKMLEQY